MTEFRHGLLIGKFYPPHLGHHAAIRRAADECERVSVLVMASAAESIALADRVGWLRAEHPDENVDVVGVRCDAPLDVTDERVWAAQVAVMAAAMRQRGGDPVDAVYCGDAYGTGLAQRFDAKLVPLDRDGRSSSAIRADLVGGWDDLAAATRAGLVTRAVVVGAESSGTTTVTRELAEHYRRRGGGWARTQWVPEFGREYTELKWRAAGGALDDLVWTAADFDAVATEQTRREEAAARSGSPLLVCDTDAFATAIWERRYLGVAARTGQAWTDVPRRDVYLLTDHRGVPWHDDGMREGDLAVRAAMTDWFADALTAAGHSWVLLTGSLDERVRLAVRTVEQLLAGRARFGEPLHGPGFGG